MKDIENKVEIGDLLALVSRRLDAKELDRALECFSQDAQLELIEDGKTIVSLQGKEAIREHLTLKMEKMDTLFHSNGASVTNLITVDQGAQAVTPCIIKNRSADPAITTDECAVYHDSLVKVDGFWYIVKRTIEIVFKSVH